MDFHTICNAGTSELLDVQCKFIFKLDCKILRYGRFKILAEACPGEVMVLIQNFLFHHFISRLLLKLGF